MADPATWGYIISGVSAASSVYTAVKKPPTIQKPKEQADPNSLIDRRKKERSLAARYDSGTDASDLTNNNTLG